jgi:hypothetical protein
MLANPARWCQGGAMRRTLPLLLCALVTALVATLAPSVAATAAPEVVWLCRPGLAHDPCEIPLDTTYQRADGTARVATEPRAPQRSRAIDCFYVYPTVSNQLTPIATKRKDPEIVSIAKYQAARFSSRCRVFAPVYRQGTLAGIPALPLGAYRIGYRDVAAAWKDYLAHDNHGRGVVLIGHSQGSIMLRQLIRKEIDPDPAVRRRLVGALLLGGNVTVARGSTTGGDFQHVPVCTKAGQAGCVVAYSTYSTDPTESFFGNSSFDATALAFGFRTGPRYRIACTDPGVLSGDRGPVGVLIPSEPFAFGPIALGIAYTTKGRVPTADTTWVEPAYRFTGACRTIHGANVFRYDPVGDSLRPLEFPPTWGTHLLDGNLGLEKLLRIVDLQTRTWLAR